MMQPITGCKPFDMDSEVVPVGGIPSLMPEGIVPKPESLPFGTVGGANPGTAAPVDEDVVGGGVPDVGVVVVGVGVVLVGVGVAGDDAVDPDAGKTQEPVLGFELVNMAAPPKSQLVCAGFFWK